MICEYCKTEHTPDPFICIARMGERIEELEEAAKKKDKQIAALKSSLLRVATSMNLFSAIAIARKAIGAGPDSMAESRKEAIENEQYVP